MTHVFRRVPGIVAAACALVLVACSGTTTSSTAAEEPPSQPESQAAPDAGEVAGDTCSLVSRELAAAAMGADVSEGEGGDLFPEGSYCVFGTDDPAVRVEVQVVSASRDEFDAQVETFGLSETVSGLGDAAFVRETSVQGEVGTWLYAFGNGNAVSVDVQGPDDQEAQLEAMEAIVEAVLGAGS